MLGRLTIENYALIKRADINWTQGWTALTGETGAGKSIVLDALGLVLGARADASVLRDPQKKCIVEAQFTLGEAALKFVAGHDLDCDLDCDKGQATEQLTVRRVIAPGGRSRAFVGDEPVRLEVLRELAPLLIDFHGQDDGHRLFKSAGRLHAIDAEGGREVAAAKNAYESAFGTWTALVAEQNRRLAAGASADLDYLQFQSDELLDAELESLDWAGLEMELSELEHAEDIQRALQSAASALEGDGGELSGAIADIQRALGAVAEVVKASPACGPIHDRLRSVRIELEDLLAECGSAAENIVADPRKMEQLGAQRDLIMRLMTKHRAGDPAALQVRHVELKGQLEEARHRTERLAEIDGEIQAALEETTRSGETLHTLRSAASMALAEKTTAQLGALKMPAVQLYWTWSRRSEPAAQGLYSHDLLFSANPGHPAQAIEKVASGGERSRLLLAMRAVLAANAEVPTLILDEIDTGVSGDVADRMARLMADIAQNTQVIVITHLPQVAARAEHQQRISKSTGDGTALTHIEELDEEARIEELAAMLSGSEITEDARSQARQLRNFAQPA